MTGVLLLLVVGVAILWGLRAFARSVMFPGDPTPLPPHEVLVSLGLRELRYTTADGLELLGAYAPPRDPAAPRIACFHGNAESAARNLELAASLAADGWGVALVEHRGYGGLAGRPSERGFYEDGEAALKALGSLGFASREVVLVGRSLGTGVALELARRGHGRALVLLAPYTSMVDVGRLIAGPLARVAVVDRFDNLAKAPRIAQPCVVIHGTNDEVIPFAMGERVSQTLPHARFLPLPGVGHNDLPDLAELLRKVVPPLLAQAEGR